MKLDLSSHQANINLLENVSQFLRGSPKDFRDDVLYAVRISAPLRERTFLVKLGAELSGSTWLEVEPIAVASELFMISAFTADDVIDGADLRSGQNTLFKRRGASRAFLIAEWIHAIAQIYLSKKEDIINNRCFSKACSLVRNTFSELIRFQYVESSYENNINISIDTIDKLARGRTGKLIESCLVAPAIISKNAKLKRILSECGHWFGIAFQHRDDVLDIISDRNIVGKPVLSDLVNGQPNIVIVHALTKNTHKMTKELILQYFGKASSHPQIRNQISSCQPSILKALKESGSLLFACNLVNEYCHRALISLSEIPLSSARNKLEKLIQLVSKIELPWDY
jgi:geranylgeranyl pyrophosphate synthase